TVRLIVQSGSAGSAPFDALGLTGTGQIVGVLDLPLDWDHCAFDDPANPIGPVHRKIEAYNAPFAGVSAHGTHVCGTLVGDSTQGGNLRGVAPGARLVFNTVPAFDESPLRQRLELHASQGAAIHSNSWGDDQSSVYGGLARAVDAFCWEHDENLVVIAVSNGSVLRTPENAKNALAVAATQDSPMQHRFCVGAGGPTADGRRKPDLVAPGCSVYSAYPFGAGCPTVFSSGTSMATPAVAGAAAITRQTFIEGRRPPGAFTPNGALLKAVLIAGAADLADEPGWPSSREGWGRVLLTGSLPPPGEGRDLLVEQAWNNGGAALATGDSFEIRFEVIDPGEPLRVVLSWHDAPGDFGAADPVVNDLDLSVETPGGVVYLGNNIDEIAGDSVPGGSPDTRNNVEVISIWSPEAGVHALRVD
ncbi:MAG: S8 family serine peptidase, partial [Phycisphaerales bacterium]|nr:S8 family serine peptidase [Phycisphaerales bacterium]